jgi:hypothetical protein
MAASFTGHLMRSTLTALAAAAAALVTSAHAGELRPSGKLLLTGGVSTIEGSGGGGLASWAVITGYETRDGIGADAHATLVTLPDYQFRAAGAAVGLYDRLELSYAHQWFDTQGTGAKLGLGRGFTFEQDVVGAKLRVLGDAVYAQDSWLPQVAVGAQWKRSGTPVVEALGARKRSGVDLYAAATKVLLDQSLLLNATVRATRANQTGLLGFGGPNKGGYSAEFEGSAAYLLSRNLAVGAEYRSKPDNLGLKENDWFDLFAAYALNKNLSVTVGYADLGEIATFKSQHGLYLSLQSGF